MALNSYENRVYQIGLESDDMPFIIAKFYRPQRWSDDQILEEHQFAQRLTDHEIPVVAPLQNADGNTLFHFEQHRFALFPRVGGYAPEPGNLEQLERLGALLGRMHLVGDAESFKFREIFSYEQRFVSAKNFLIEHEFIPADMLDMYQQITNRLAETILKQTQAFKPYRFIQCHGDWHLGNILWRDEHGGKIVDLDDCMNAPAVQDIWMMLSGAAQEQALQLQAILKGYEAFRLFDKSELKLIESLRSIRIVYYAAWLALRWQDPAFPQNFPWFDTRAYWQQHIKELQDQLELIETNLLDYF